MEDRRQELGKKRKGAKGAKNVQCYLLSLRSSCLCVSIEAATAIIDVMCEFAHDSG